MRTIGGYEATDAPQWLAEFLIQPPFWFKALIIVAAGLSLAIVGRKVLRRDGYIERDEQRAMVLIVATIDGIALAVVASIHLLNLGYIGDVAVGLVAGFAVVEVLRRVLPLVLDGHLEERTQLAFAWFGLLGLSMVVVQVSATTDVLYPSGLNMGVSIVALCMLTWTVMQEWGPGETVGEALRESAE